MMDWYCNKVTGIPGSILGNWSTVPGEEQDSVGEYCDTAFPYEQGQKVR
jgi:hypothetical protein